MHNGTPAVATTMTGLGQPEVDKVNECEPVSSSDVVPDFDVGEVSQDNVESREGRPYPIRSRQPPRYGYDKEFSVLV